MFSKLTLNIEGLRATLADKLMNPRARFFFMPPKMSLLLETLVTIVTNVANITIFMNVAKMFIQMFLCLKEFPTFWTLMHTFRR